MRLFISDYEKEDKLDCHVISIDEFNDICYHPYLKSVKWESVIVDLDDRITRSYIKQLVCHNTKVVPRLIKEHISVKGLLLLAEIYPDSMAEIFSWSKLPYNEMLAKVKELREKHHWTIEY